jgi:hypothetical protein
MKTLHTFGKGLRNLTFTVVMAAAVVGRADVIVNLDATQLATGPLATWPNSGSLPGDFTSAGTVVPQVVTVADGKGVSFIGGTAGAAGTHYIGPVAPPSVTGSSSRTVEAWVYNPSAQGEETVFGWGRRGGAPDGSNVSFNHGTDPTFGAVGHWGASDIGWNGRIDFSKWTYIVYSWDSNTLTTTVYHNGQVANTEPGITLVTHTLSTATPPAPLNFRVARQNNATGTPSGTGVGEITIGRIRVHDVALDAATIQANYDTEKGVFGLGDTDNDGMTDGYENRFPFLDRNNPADAALDFDNDGLTNLAEFQRGTAPDDSDSDNDGASDGAEVNRMDGGVAAPTNPLRADTDGDGLADGAETDTAVYVSPTDTGTDPLVVDSDGDTFSDGHEVLRASNPNDPGSVPDLSQPTPLINLNATALSVGPLSTWPNTGVLPGDFVANPGAPPAVSSVQAVRSVSLDGVNHFYTGPGTPSFITGNSARTIEAWVFNPVPADEETIFSWGRRGGPDGSNCSFNHGVNPAFGAVGHWGAGPDIGWAGNVAAARWTFVAYTFNPATATATVFQDGVPVNSETIGVLNTHGTDNSPAANRLPFRVGSQNEPNGTPTTGLRGSMSIARLRVYEVALDPAVILENFERDSDDFGLDDRDGDGIPTWYERLFSFLNPEDPNDGPADQDGDAATNQQEYEAGSAPDNPDTDGDGATDGAEIHRMAGGSPAPTNPVRPDSDYDGLLDGVETDTDVFVSRTDTGSDPLSTDSDGDTFGDGQEVFHDSNPNDSASTPDFGLDPVAIVNLDATGMSVGPLASWPNAGALGGVFRAGAEVPSVDNSRGVHAVTFDGVNHLYTGPGAPSFLTGNRRRTVEAWLYNPDIMGEENIFSWGMRGGPDGSNCSFNHGTDPAFGAVGHWGAGPDIGWAGNISAARWTFVAYTYDAATVAVYRDGVLANSETGISLNTHTIDVLSNALPFRVAAQNEPGGAATPGLRGSMTIAKIRVYDDALSADKIAEHYASEVGAFTLGCPNNMTVAADPGQCGATVNFTATAADSCTPASGSSFPLGTTTVTCTGGGGQCSFTVTVQDSTGPVLNCQNLIVGTDPGQCAATVADYNVSAVDCPGTTVNCTPAPGATFPLGSAAVTCTATDPAGNTSSCTFTVTVEDREAPVVVIRAGANPAGLIKAKAEDAGSGFYQLLASDNCDGAPQIFIKDAASNFVSGPYPSGTMIKLTPNSGANKTLKGVGFLTAHVLTAGDAQVYATDGAGNVSAPVVKSN